MNNPITATLKEQFSRAFKILREAMDGVPEKEWKSGRISYLIPARQVYHILMVAERYTCDLSQDEYLATRKYDLNWLATVEPMPDREEISSDVQLVEDKIMEWLDKQGDEGLLAKETLSPWTGERVLDKALYLLRHVHHHLGELIGELIHRDLPRPTWNG